LVPPLVLVLLLVLGGASKRKGTQARELKEA
jgi:hypothetical protein